MKKVLFGLLFVSSIGFSNQSLNCSKCGGYGSPFGPGYSYACYFVTNGQKPVQAYRFNDLDECTQQMAQNPDCKSILTNMSGIEDPCWKM